ncbi:ufm1-specific protease 1 [Aplysia californica]|uniref:Ufm1-specific protease 1 n=1 Tax=Aplysia californica TaxID=6500 RepID=A0ABM1A3U4_APLCA|nr:ufm1-specific protease 1 [Aplysia californica]
MADSLKSDVPSEKYVSDVHLVLPGVVDDSLCSCSYTYYHYLCDGVDDRGWGCGYRTLQTLCSWVCRHPQLGPSLKKNYVPSIVEIQKALVSMQDKPESFIGSRQWIGSFEVSLCLDYFYEVPGKVIHVNSGSEISGVLPELHQHFQVVGAPIMMGGETDNSSKGIVGVRLEPPALLIVDPHCCEKDPDATSLQLSGFVKWLPIADLHLNSFYNLCLPKPSLS